MSRCCAWCAHLDLEIWAKDFQFEPDATHASIIASHWHCLIRSTLRILSYMSHLPDFMKLRIKFCCYRVLEPGSIRVKVCTLVFASHLAGTSQFFGHLCRLSKRDGPSYVLQLWLVTLKQLDLTQWPARKSKLTTFICNYCKIPDNI